MKASFRQWSPKLRTDPFNAFTIFLGFIIWGIVLVYHNIADGDLWAKLAMGSFLFDQGELMRQDYFAFTPALAHYVEHEWGAGAIFYLVLAWGGPTALMVLKVALAFGTTAISLKLGRMMGCRWPTLLVYAVPAAFCILPAYLIVVRSHAFTYVFFALTLYCLEQMKRGVVSLGPVLVLMMVLWVNIHGGFVAGFGAIGVYTVFACPQPKLRRAMLWTFLGCLLATFINPYGMELWDFVIESVLHPYPYLSEWRPLTLWEVDGFIGFRLAFFFTIIVLALGWRKTAPTSWPGLTMLAITIYLGWHSRRLAPFFGICSLAFVSTSLQTIFSAAYQTLAPKFGRAIRPAVLVAAGYGILFMVVAPQLLPSCTGLVLAPVGQYPVRETDILSQAQARGNVAIPFQWGSYVTWRLHPRIKVSCDGRYNSAYPDSTFIMNWDFFYKVGPRWDRLLRNYPVDYIMLDLTSDPLQPNDLTAHGFALVWLQPGVSALLARPDKVQALRETAQNLPETSIEPLDVKIARQWRDSRAGDSKSPPGK